MCVDFLYTVDVSIPSLSLLKKQLKKGSLLSSSDSMVNFIGGLPEFKWSNKCFSLPFLTGSYLPEVPVDRQSDRMTLGLL